MHVTLVLALIITQVVFVSGTAQAATTGSTIEVATLVNTVDFVDLEIDEVKSVWNDATPPDEVQTLYNDATSGTFTITFDGQTTIPIAYNALAATLEFDLETLTNIVDVTVTGTGVEECHHPLVYRCARSRHRHVPNARQRIEGRLYVHR